MGNNINAVAEPNYKAVHGFIVWLEENGYELAKYEEGDISFPSRGYDMKKMVNEYFEVDEVELENERRALLEELRS